MIGFVAVVFLIALAIEPRNSMWNTLVLSESLSNSFAVLTIAAWLRAAARPSPAAIRLAWLAMIAWVLVRDTNVLPAAVVIVPVAVLVALVVREREHHVARSLLSGALVFTLVCGYVYVAQATSHRTVYSVYNNVGMRVLPDPALTKWFVANGMPIDEAVRARTGHNAWDDNEAFLQAPDLAKLRTWAKGPGGRLLLESFVVRAPDWWKRLHHDLPNTLSYKDDAYDYFHVAQRLPDSLPAPLGQPRTTGGLAFGIVLTIAGIVLMAIDRRRRWIAVFCGVMLLSACIDIYVSYAGDPLEVSAAPGRFTAPPLGRLDHHDRTRRGHCGPTRTRPPRGPATRPRDRSRRFADGRSEIRRTCLSRPSRPTQSTKSRRPRPVGHGSSMSHAQ